MSSIATTKKENRFIRFFRELKWTKLDTYIMRKFIPALFGSLVLFIAIYELTQIFQEIKYIPQDVDSALLMKRYLMDSVYWIQILQPFSFLFATVFVLSKMINTRELIAIISTGTSIYRITFYMVLFTIVYYMAMVLFLNDHVIFPLYQKSLIYKEVNFNRATIDQLDRLKDNRNFSIFGSNNLLYIVSYYNAVSREMEDVTIVQFLTEEEMVEESAYMALSNLSSQWIVSNIISEEATRQLEGDYKIRIKLRIDADGAYWDAVHTNWVFQDGKIRYLQTQGSIVPEEEFETQTFDFVEDPPKYFEKIWVTVNAMTTSESKEYVERLKKAHQDWKEAEAQRLAKFSYPVGILLVVFAGIGIVNVSSRKSSFIINLILSLALFIIYYVMFASGLALAGKGVLSPQIGAFTGSIFFTFISVFLYLRARS